MSSSNPAQSRANDTSQMRHWAPLTTTPSPEKEPDSTSEGLTDNMYRPSPEFRAGLGSPQHYPSICHLSMATSISTCSFLQRPAGLEASPSPSFTPCISSQEPQASNPHFQACLWSLVKDKHSGNPLLSLGDPAHRPKPRVQCGGNGPQGHGPGS